MTEGALEEPGAQQREQVIWMAHLSGCPHRSTHRTGGSEALIAGRSFRNVIRLCTANIVPKYGSHMIITSASRACNFLWRHSRDQAEANPPSAELRLPVKALQTFNLYLHHERGSSSSVTVHANNARHSGHAAVKKLSRDIRPHEKVTCSRSS